jgi:uncharacterized membrane protein
MILIPAGAFTITFICDVMYILTGSALWWNATLPLLLIGVAGALLAAIPGFIDYFTVVPQHNAQRTATIHMVLNLAAVAVFAFNAWWRWQVVIEPTGVHLGFFFTVVGSLLIAIAGWLGGPMVYEKQIGVLEKLRTHESPPERTRGAQAAD